MSIYPFFKGLFPQPVEPSADPQASSAGFRPRYGNRQANQRARGDLHPAAPGSSNADLPSLQGCCAC